MWRLIAILLTFSCTGINADERVELFYAFVGNDGDSETFPLDLPEQVLELTVESTGDMGDVDIFVFRPNEESYLDFSFCSNRKQDSNEVCQLGTPRAGRYLIKAKAFQPNSSSTIRIAYSLSYGQAQNKVKRSNSSKPQLLMLDESQSVEINESLRFVTYVHPNQKRLSFQLEQTSEDVRLKVMEAGAAKNRPPVCEVIVRKQTSGQCNIDWPEGTYYAELVAQSDSVVNAQLIAATDIDIDTESVNVAWSNPEVKALRWDVPKEFPLASIERTYFYEANPRLENLIISTNNNGIARIWNGFAINSLLVDVFMGAESLANLNQTHCMRVFYRNEVLCNYDLDRALATELLRIKLTFLQSNASAEMVHRETMVEHFTNPSPTCPKKTGCFGDPEI